MPVSYRKDESKQLTSVYDKMEGIGVPGNRYLKDCSRLQATQSCANNNISISEPLELRAEQILSPSYTWVV